MKNKTIAMLVAGLSVLTVSPAFAVESPTVGIMPEKVVEATIETEVDPKVVDSLDESDFVLCGKVLSLPFSYSEISDVLDFDPDGRYAEGYSLESGTILSSAPELVSDVYGTKVNAGFANYSDELKDVAECDVVSLNSRTRRGSTEIDGERLPLVLKGGVTWGSSADDVRAAFGKPTDDSVEDSYELMEYELNDGLRLSFYVFGDDGVGEIDMYGAFVK